MSSPSTCIGTGHGKFRRVYNHKNYKVKEGNTKQTKGDRNGYKGRKAQRQGMGEGRLGEMGVFKFCKCLNSDEGTDFTGGEWGLNTNTNAKTPPLLVKRDSHHKGHGSVDSWDISAKGMGSTRKMVGKSSLKTEISPT